MYEGFTLRWSVQCEACGRMVSVSRIATTLPCTCGASRDLTQEIWKRTFTPSKFAEALGFNNGEGEESLTVGGNGAGIKVAHGRCRPRCQGCKQNIPLGELAAFATAGGGECEKCKARFALREADDLCRALVPTAKYVFNEAPAEVANQVVFLICEIDEDTHKKARWQNAGVATKHARSSKITADEAAALAEHKDEDVREALARNPATPAQVLEKLASDREEDVRKNLIRNKAVSVELLAKIASDTDEDVRESLAKLDTPLPPEALAKLVGDSAEDVRELVAKRGDLTIEQLEKLARDPASDVRQLVAKHPSITPAILEIFASDSHYRVREAVALHPAAPTNALVILAPDTDSDVRRALDARLADLPAEAIEAMASASSDDVRKLAATHPKLSLESLRRLAKDSDDDVKQAARARRKELRAQGVEVDPKPPAPLIPPPRRPVDEPEARAPFHRTLRVFAVLAVGCIGAGAVLWRDVAAAVAHREFPIGVPLVELGAVFASIALALWLSRDPFEVGEASHAPARDPDADLDDEDPAMAEYNQAMREVERLSKGRSGALRPPFEVGSGAVAFVIGAVMAIGIVTPSAVVGRSAIAVAIPAFLVALGGLIFALVVRRHKKQFALVERLAGGELVEGTVVAHELVASRSVGYQRHSSTRTENYTKPDGKTGTRNVTSTWLAGNESNTPLARFTVRTRDGEIEIAESEVVWGAPIAYRPVGESTSTEVRTYAAIYPGDSIVLVHGHRQTPAMFAAASDARATLASLMKRWRLAMAALVVVNVAVIAFGIVVATSRYEPPVTTKMIPVPAEGM